MKRSSVAELEFVLGVDIVEPGAEMTDPEQWNAAVRAIVAWAEGLEDQPRGPSVHTVPGPLAQALVRARSVRREEVLS